MGTVQVHVEPPPIPLIKSNNDEKMDKDCVKLKLHRDPTSQNFDLYEFKVALFDNVDTEEFLLFVRNFNMTLEASVILTAGAKIQYLRIIVCGDDLQ